MTNKGLYIAAAFMAGAFLPLQALVNARLGAAVGGPAPAAMISVAIGTFSLILFIMAMRIPFPSLAMAAGLPWWVWVGGVLGAYYVATAALTVPVLGAASMIALAVLGQMVASMVLDHFGVLNAVQPINMQRLAGAVLLLAGVWLIMRPADMAVP